MSSKESVFRKKKRLVRIVKTVNRWIAKLHPKYDGVFQVSLYYNFRSLRLLPSLHYLSSNTVFSKVILFQLCEHSRPGSCILAGPLKDRLCWSVLKRTSGLYQHCFECLSLCPQSYGATYASYGWMKSERLSDCGWLTFHPLSYPWSATDWQISYGNSFCINELEDIPLRRRSAILDWTHVAK